ncbi:MAG: TonB family protein [Opitutaceae bacterium]
MTRMAVVLLSMLALLAGNGHARAFRAPIPEKYPSPSYPDEMEGSGLDGRAELIFTVLEDGSVENPSVREASHPAFAQAALEVIEGWRFKPGLRDGRIQAMRVALPFVFYAGPARKANAVLGRVVYTDIDDIIYSPVEVGGLPEITYQPMPPYPKAMLGSGRTEIVNLTMVVGPDGRGYNMEIEGYPPKGFAFVAVVAASRYRFKPVMYRGKPVHVYTRLSIVISEDPDLARRSGSDRDVVGETFDPLADYPEL